MGIVPLFCYYVEVHGVRLEVVVHGLAQAVDVAAQAFERGLQPLEVPGPGVDEVRLDDLFQFQGGEHIRRIGIKDRVGEWKDVLAGEGRAQGVAVGDKTLLVEVGQRVQGVVADDGEDLQIVLVCDRRQFLRHIDAVDVLGDHVGHVVGHAPVLQDGDDTGYDEDDRDGAQGERRLRFQRQTERVPPVFEPSEHSEHFSQLTNIAIFPEKLRARVLYRKILKVFSENGFV